MIACDECEVWQHTSCVGIPEASVAPEKFICSSCESKSQSTGFVDCCCGLSAKNYDDGWRMVYCDECSTWQHTICVGIPKDEEPFENYACPACKKKSSSLKTCHPKSTKKLKVLDKGPMFGDKKVSGQSIAGKDTIKNDDHSDDDPNDYADPDTDNADVSNSSTPVSDKQSGPTRIRIVVPSPTPSIISNRVVKFSKGSTVRQRLFRKLNGRTKSVRR